MLDLIERQRLPEQRDECLSPGAAEHAANFLDRVQRVTLGDKLYGKGVIGIDQKCQTPVATPVVILLVRHVRENGQIAVKLGLILIETLIVDLTGITGLYSGDIQVCPSLRLYLYENLLAFLLQRWPVLLFIPLLQFFQNGRAINRFCV